MPFAHSSVLSLCFLEALFLMVRKYCAGPFFYSCIVFHHMVDSSSIILFSSASELGNFLLRLCKQRHDKFQICVIYYIQSVVAESILGLGILN